MFGINQKSRDNTERRPQAQPPTAAPGNAAAVIAAPQPRAQPRGRDPQLALLLECRDMLAAVLDAQAQQRVQVAELIESLRELGALDVQEDDEPQG